MNLVNSLRLPARGGSKTSGCAGRDGVAAEGCDGGPGNPPRGGAAAMDAAAAGGAAAVAATARAIAALLDAVAVDSTATAKRSLLLLAVAELTEDRLAENGPLLEPRFSLAGAAPL